MASGKSFKDVYEVSSTFAGGYKDPNDVKIVGVDIPLEDWNQDLWDEARIAYAKAHPIDPKALIATVEAGGSIPAIAVTKRRGMILAVEGRRRILGTRAANLILAKNGAKGDELIEIPVIPDRGQDLETSVRIGNEGRLDDPPWVRAQNAARLLARGKAPEHVRAVFGVEKQTLDNWGHYLNCCPEIRAQVENEALPKEKRLPFAIAIELGRLGKGEDTAQKTVLAKARELKAALSGDRGKENIKALAKAWKDGKLSEATAAGEEPEPAPQPLGQPLIPSHSKPAPVVKCGNGIQCAFHASGGKKADDCSTKPAKAPKEKPAAAKAPKEKPAADVVIAGRKLSPQAVREVLARLEPTEQEPHEDEAIKAVYAAVLVIVGDDPSGDGLREWLHIYNAFRPALRSEKVK